MVLHPFTLWILCGVLTLMLPKPNGKPMQSIEQVSSDIEDATGTRIPVDYLRAIFPVALLISILVWPIGLTLIIAMWVGKWLSEK